MDKSEHSKELDIIKLALEQIKTWVVLTDIYGDILYANSVVEDISGYSIGELLGRNPSVLKSDLMPHEIYVELWENVINGKAYKCVFANRHKDGNLYYLASSIYPIKDREGEIKYFLSIGSHMDDEDEFVQQIHEAMHYDRLTGFHNRNSFVEAIYQIREERKDIGILAISIKNMGLINTMHGFVFGDYVIKEVASKIKKVLGDDGILARIDGKRFGILLIDLNNPYRVIRIIELIEEAFEEPILVKGEELDISLSYGISMGAFDKDIMHRDAEMLLTNAELALSRAGEGDLAKRYRFYMPSMNQEISERVDRERQINSAFRDDEFIPYFQPIIDITAGKISGLEALMRHRKPTGEIVAAGHFIDILEETGLIVDVGFNLIRKICAQMKRWIDGNGYNLPVSINLSPMQFRDIYFCNKVLDIIGEAGIPPRLINFEITESMLIEDIDRTMSILENMKERGFNVLIDDFGTGYSSLSYIQRLKIDCIKIDMSFLRNIVESNADQTIVKAIVMMSKGLNLQTIAEGIETKEQLDMIIELGCDMGQGYYWSHPLPAEGLGQYIYRREL